MSLDNKEELRIPTVKTIKYLLDPIVKKLDHLDSVITSNSTTSSESKYYRNSDLKKLFGFSSNTIIKYREIGLLPYTGYSGSICARVFGVIVPVISV